MKAIQGSMHAWARKTLSIPIHHEGSQSMEEHKNALVDTRQCNIGIPPLFRLEHPAKLSVQCNACGID